MRAVWMRFRSELRTRWRGWLGLLVLVGLAGGAVIALVAGARRTDSAYGRFALLAALAVGHALVSAVNRRRRDLALLKTLGFVRGQVSATVACQASTLAVARLVVGIPLGIVAGRWAWALVAGGLGVATDAALPALVLLVVIPAVLLIANAVAFLPGRVAARTRPAVVLRAE